MLKLRTVALAACLLASSVPASAEMLWLKESTSATGPLGQTWTGSWAEGWNIAEYFSEVAIDGNTLSYEYLSPDFWYGVPTQTYVFSTTAAKAGALTLNIDLRSNAQWTQSATSMYIWQGSTDHAQLLAGATADAIVSRTITLDLGLDEAWGFMAVGGTIGDEPYFNGPVYGSFTVTAAGGGGEVPEPLPLALLGLGALGMAAARRKVG